MDGGAMVESKQSPLPDDALLAVLAFLSPAELLRCRLVCRRFRDLCLHPDLWRSVWLSDAGLLRAVLRLAPCLGSMFLKDMFFRPTLQAVAPLVPSITCAVASVTFMIQQQESVTLVIDLIRKLSALGGLRVVQLDTLSEVHFPPAFFELIYGLKDLCELELRMQCSPPLSDALLSTQAVKPSLTKLIYGYSADYFVQLLLRTHAATLENVCLMTGGQLPSALRTIVAPNLQSLTCHLNSDLAYSEALSHVHKLKLIAFGEYPFPPEALDFLRQSAQLRSVKLTFVKALPSPADPLFALAASPSAPSLESLSLLCASDSLRAMAGVLARFPSLQTLTISILQSITYMSADAKLCDDFMRAVSPESAPRLTSLTLPPVKGCIHSWLHGPAVQDLLARNPGLHLRADCDAMEFPAPHCDCHWCRWGCHQELKTAAGLRRCSFAAHFKEVGCPKGCVKWL
ncbi:uncharacterized protein LOC117642760 [Thrips palmi]|uniref:Uncharacterized protein LOC117642760 n=1 Tax=Thrips palmi TaxID=161013 RepID=A0A6P8YC01_THRPL|nr:uncharacterized protein LOC117642760 [Thrips palmi]XP_034237174.1 uncharacterized protein LOC117642760 [Thrips palmi]XP_034237175.1 uncharacterized protein LOC117642760 [Thrips palmi]XP_034237176.1 uncharacterized protein LOC117642760 [Thrips palmi]